MDATSAATIPPDATARGDVNAREAGVVAGLGVAAAAFHLVMGDEGSVTDRVADGTHVEAGTRVMTVEGPTRGLLTAERTGTLGMVTELMGEHYEEEGESKLRELATILEPLIIVAMGVIVATIVMAVMLPMFDIATMAR